ncbi:hypothetical protein KY290_035016 [Solanum tuberosum]|uniref:Reverse transcriptase zinc-binding domain-containing protein n=1 Tax=Solanum tuberosum TaxID=4113 RepID=A0ABQ7U5E4_SOLTU|nr:hypothetical protein KY289_034490 [Solanum tuberosum]KAH0646342.1 hypothetical protein KY284_034226 [Solanum tuberosum]KAH0649043.1 hypothetical protein KY285_034291 [Solanum tuberosum]KAH0741973.1 hypothetical protein KY290_035016 [Solanum tuberosum]
MEQHIFWKIGEGNIMFWWDQWLSSGPIYLQLVQSSKPKNTKVKEFWENNRWDFEDLEEVIPKHLVEEIRSVYTNFGENKDKPIWKLHPSGKFTLVSAFQELRQKEEIFNHYEAPIRETYNHLFAAREIAKCIWSWISRPLGIDSSNNIIIHIDVYWWNTKANNAVHGMLPRIIPRP